MDLPFCEKTSAHRHYAWGLQRHLSAWDFAQQQQRPEVQRRALWMAAVTTTVWVIFPLVLVKPLAEAEVSSEPRKLRCFVVVVVVVVLLLLQLRLSLALVEKIVEMLRLWLLLLLLRQPWRRQRRPN